MKREGVEPPAVEVGLHFRDPLARRRTIGIELAVPVREVGPILCVGLPEVVRPEEKLRLDMIDADAHKWFAIG